MKLPKINILWANLFCILIFCLSVQAIPGDLDTTFDGGGKVLTAVGGSSYAENKAIQADEKIIFVGYGVGTGPGGATITRFNADKTLDKKFGNLGKNIVSFRNLIEFSNAYSVVIQSDGRIILGGFALSTNNISFFALARFNSHGFLDVGYGNSGKVETTMMPYFVLRQEFGI